MAAFRKKWTWEVPEAAYEELAERLNQYREEHNLSQAELAEQLGVGVSTVSTWEQKKKFPRNSATRKALLKVCKIDVERIMERNDSNGGERD